MTNTIATSPVRVISSQTIKPSAATKTRRIELTPWDLRMLSIHYIQKGLLFHAPAGVQGGVDHVEAVVARLKTALSLSLVHFFPLAGRLASTATEDRKDTFMYVDCGDQGAEFIRAVADGVSVADVLLASGEDIPGKLIRRFFPMDLAVNHDGHTVPLLAAQLTMLADGMFLGCSLNHAVVDGTSFWHFLNTWAEICKDRLFKGDGTEAAHVDGSNYLFDTVRVSRPPVHDRWFFDRNAPIRMPFGHPDEFIERSGYRLEFRERLFHFSPEDMVGLKARANSSNYCNRGGVAADGGCADDANTTNTVITSFQALCALLWRAVTRARRLPDDQPTSFFMFIDNRRRLQPPLSPDYFGNSIHRAATTTTTGELLSHDLGWAALLLNGTIAAHTDRAIRDAVETWTRAPVIFLNSNKPTTQDVVMSSSPRFSMYDGCDFGWGRPVAVRCGGANKFDGKITAYPGRQGGGSVDLELTLAPDTMAALESDNELLKMSSSLLRHATWNEHY